MKGKARLRGRFVRIFVSWIAISNRKQPLSLGPPLCSTHPQSCALKTARVEARQLPYRLRRRRTAPFHLVRRGRVGRGVCGVPRSREVGNCRAWGQEALALGPRSPREVTGPLNERLPPRASYFGTGGFRVRRRGLITQRA